MRVEDLQYLLNAPDRPGRSLLRVSSEAAYRAAAVEPAPTAGLITLNLPQPAAGFLRLWTFLTAQISTDVATDFLFFNFSSSPLQDLNIGRYDFTAFPGGDQCPLIGGKMVRLPRALVAGALVVEGMEPILVGSTDLLTILAVVTAASGQTLTGRGRYVDLPI